MKNVSNEFRLTIAQRTDFYMLSDVVYADGKKQSLSRSDFYLSGNSYVDSAGTSPFPLGVGIEKQIEISLVNDRDQFSTYDFYGAKFTVYCCLDLDSGKTEKILLGTYTVTEPETYGTIITVKAVDDAYKGDTDYSTGLTFPATLRDILQDSCTTCGVSLLTTTFENDDFQVKEKPEGLTHRAIWGLCAMMAGGNARFDGYNRLEIIGYDFSLFDRKGADGGIFDGDTPYSSGDDLDGGSFNPWTEGDTVEGGTFVETKDYHVFYKAKNFIVGTDDVVITGIQISVSDENYLFGSEGYVLSISNELAEGNPQDAVNRIGSLVVGARFRPFEMDHIGYPLAEFGDVCYLVDRKQNTYQSIVTDINFTFFGYTTLKCAADSPIRNSSKYNSQLTQAVVKARLDTKKQISDYDKAVQQLTSLITQSFGVYKTEEILSDGSTVYYMHNKPMLSESQTIWKMTADAFAVSTDGGQTWNAGMDSSGNAVVNVLSAIGINFTWAKGGTLSLGGKDNEYGILRYFDSSDKLIGEISAYSSRFYNNGEYVGFIGSSGYSSDQSYRLLGINAKFGRKDIFIARELKENAGEYTPWVSFVQEKAESISSTREKGINIWDALYTHGYKIAKDETAGNYMYITAYIDFVVSSAVKFRIDTGGMNCYDDLFMNGYNIYGQSDARIKKNICKAAGSALDIVNEINLYEYDWIENGRHSSMGFIAQQVESVCEELTMDNQEGVQCIDSIGMIPYLVKAMQELSEKVDRLAAENEILKSYLPDAQKEIEELGGEIKLYSNEEVDEEWNSISLSDKEKFVQNLSKKRNDVPMPEEPPVYIMGN